MTPDTVITLTNGQKMVVLEAAAEVVDRVIAFRRSTLAGVLLCPFRKPSCGETPSESEPV